jgi:hypothetical protein
MKKLFTIALLLISCQLSFSQDEPFTPDLVSLNFDFGKPFMDNRAFDNWARTNYNKRYTNNASYGADVNLAFARHFDAGVRFGGSSGDFNYFSFYAGIRVTPRYSWLTSFLNLEGQYYFVANNDLAPVNYRLTADERGQAMELHYSTGFIGLSSRNYIRPLNIRIGKMKRSVIRWGFFVNAGYQPWKTAWKYGYYKETTSTNSDGEEETNNDFISRKVYSIPKLADKYLQTGVFVGIGI